MVIKDVKLRAGLRRWSTLAGLILIVIGVCGSIYEIICGFVGITPWHIVLRDTFLILGCTCGLGGLLIVFSPDLLARANFFDLSGVAKATRRPRQSFDQKIGAYKYDTDDEEERCTHTD